jgi:hypothetical protein
MAENENSRIAKNELDPPPVPPDPEDDDDEPDEPPE